MPSSAAPIPVRPPQPLRQISVEEYHAILDAGVFDDDDPIELLEGFLVEKMPKKPPHSVATGLANDELVRYLPRGWHLISQEPITTDDSEPEPDVGVIRGKRRDYLNRHPRPRDIGLLVEVSDATLKRDRGTKKRIYARAQIPIFWIVNLINRQIEVYTGPTGPTAKPDFRHKEVFRRGDSVPMILDGEEFGRIAVALLLP